MCEVWNVLDSRDKTKKVSMIFHRSLIGFSLAESHTNWMVFFVLTIWSCFMIQICSFVVMKFQSVFFFFWFHAIHAAKSCIIMLCAHKSYNHDEVSRKNCEGEKGTKNYTLLTWWLKLIDFSLQTPHDDRNVHISPYFTRRALTFNQSFIVSPPSGSFWP